MQIHVHTDSDYHSYRYQTRHYHRSCAWCAFLDTPCRHYTCNACLREQAAREASAEVFVELVAAGLKGLVKGSKCVARKSKRQVRKIQAKRAA